VLITADSLLHALHKSYDEILMEIEMTSFTSTLGHLFETAQGQLGKRTWAVEDGPNVRDVDLYLTTARNLLAGAGAPADEKDAQGRLAWDGTLKVGPRVVAPEEVLALLKEIQSLKFNTPGHGGAPTRIYGGERYPDFSQFRPRGHYDVNPALRNYFRCLMWLGRVDCGWNVLPPVDRVGLRVDSDRELRDAVLFCELLRDAQGLKALKSVDDIIGFMVGRSDNLTVFALLKLIDGVCGPVVLVLRVSTPDQEQTPHRQRVAKHVLALRQPGPAGLGEGIRGPTTQAMRSRHSLGVRASQVVPDCLEAGA